MRDIWAQQTIDAQNIQLEPHGPELALRRIIDRPPPAGGFKWKVWWVTASGFFTTSYSIFATNVIGPALHYVYSDCNYSSDQSLIITLTTLCGTTAGMILFGILADKYGRKPIYGVELMIVIVATIGMTTASSGHGNSMNIYGWIGFWRFLLGIGLGAEYPLSAVIAAEWSSTSSRATMMAAVFLMQPVGQLAAYILGLVVLKGVSASKGLSPNETSYEVASPIIDLYWRILIGIGAFPALFAIILRRSIPETPRFLVERGQVAAAMHAAGQVHGHAEDEVGGHTRFNAPESMRSEGSRQSEEDLGIIRRVRAYFAGVRSYLSDQGRWRPFLGVIITWYILDVAFYGLGLNSPRTISTIWMSSPVEYPAPLCNETWRSNPARPNATIYEVLEQDSIRNIMTISTGTLTGSVIVLFAIDYIPRVTWMVWMFVSLAGLFAVNGGSFFVVHETNHHALTVTLYVLAQLLFNLGPNTITWILPAELFGTRYRATFYGLAAAGGKLGAVTIQLIMIFTHVTETTEKFGIMLVLFCPAMLLGALVAWVWIPEVQYPRGYIPASYERVSEGDMSWAKRLKIPSRPLEEIDKNPTEGQDIGFTKILARVLGLRRRSTGAGHVEQAQESRSEEGHELQNV